MAKYTCPCCGFKTIYRQDTFYDLCPVCFWETDPIQLTDPLYEGGANIPSLAVAQQNFILFGACEKRFIHATRLPESDESKDETFIPYDETITGLKYVKRHWGEASGQIQTNDWGVCTYYLEINAAGDVLKQIQIYANGNLLKYSNLHDEDAFGGLALVQLDVTKEGYKPLLQNTFYNVWNIPIIEKFSKNKLSFAGWYLPICKDKILYPNPQFNDDETIIRATLDNRFVIELSYQKGGENWPKNGFFLLEAIEGHVGIHYFTYMNWEEAAIATQTWINDLQATNKTVDTPKEEEAKMYPVRVMIDNQLFEAELTTWRNMDWDVEKFRNIQLRVNNDVFLVNNTFQDFENMLLVLKQNLPDNYQIETCFFCRFSGYNPVGKDNFGDLDCFKNCKEAITKISDKHSLFNLYETSKNQIFKVEETHYCSDFQLINKSDWAFKKQTEN